MNKKYTLRHYLFNQGLFYSLGLLMLLIVDYINLYIPQYIGDVMDGLTSFSYGLQDVIHTLFVMLIFVGIITLGRVFWRVFIFGASRQVEKQMRNDLFEKLLTLSQTYFNYHKTGDLMSHFTNDIDAIHYAIGPAVISCFDAIVMTTMVLYKMIVYVNLRLTLLCLIPMAAIGIGGYFFGNEIENSFSAKQEAFSKLSDFVQESISGQRVIKAFVQEKNQDREFSIVNKYNLKKNMDVVKLMASVMPLLEFVIGISYAITIFYGGYLAITAQITLGRFVAFNQYLAMLVWPMIAFGDAIISFSQGRASMKRLQEVFDEIPHIEDSANVKDIRTLHGNITFNNVSFQYGKEFEDSLKDVSFQIEQGETFAILGKTGAGKSTLVSVLARLYDIDRGSILFDGYFIKDIPLKTLRESIAYVPQDSYLFSDSISNNVRFGKLSASQKEIEEACKMACVHDNIVDFPDQYETIVGERGVTLSGGQKQRCAIARALLKDAPILVLDDSLSAVDTDTEDQLLDNLKKIRNGKTTILIAHRVSTIRNANHILVLEEGKMAEYGTFEELMAKNGIFKEMYDKQQLEKQLQGEEPWKE
ncbi:MAG: ABC transporter ATP-binding protein [Firmicutes bacterium]|nr:ABC transporter ATP-binding protein [Bacillota bacterium]